MYYFGRILIFYICSTSLSVAQTTMIDNRDSSEYDVVQIGDYLWFQENLRFITPTSWCGENPNSAACTNNNFYYPTDLISICPEGWKVPTWSEYRKAIKIIEEYYKIETELYSSEAPALKDLWLGFESINGLTLLNDTTFFDMTAMGWVQGDKWVPQKQSNQWIIHDISNTPQPHLHISSERILMHSHGHNVLDKLRKLRRFSVRCVKCLTE